MDVDVQSVHSRFSNAGCRRRVVGASTRRGLSLVDVLVSLAVVTILVSLTLPSFSKVKEHASRVACRSNVRQVGLGMAMFADANRDSLPPSVFVTPSNVSKSQPQETVVLRLSAAESGGATTNWDGLGVLFRDEYLEPIKIFYCPSYDAEHDFARYATDFASMPERVYGNYQYRGQGPNGETKLTSIVPPRSALISDCLRTRAEYSHRDGSNVLRADLSLYWYSDAAGTVSASLPDEAMAGSLVKPIIENAWKQLDKGNAALTPTP